MCAPTGPQTCLPSCACLAHALCCRASLPMSTQGMTRFPCSTLFSFLGTRMGLRQCPHAASCLGHLIDGLTLVIITTSYMVDLHALLIWISLLILYSLYLRLRVQVYPHLRESFLRPTSSRSTFASLTHPNLHLLHLLSRPIMHLLAFHTHHYLAPGFSILKPMIIFPIIRIFSLILLLPLLYPLLS